MDSHGSHWGLTTQFDAFLFAPVCEDLNGLQISVLSALARMNRDPWKEAARLAAMPKASAETALVSTLQLAAANGWDPMQANKLSARLVSLLPHAGVIATVTRDAAQRPPAPAVSLLMWLALVMTMALLAPHYRAATSEGTASTSAPLPRSQQQIPDRMASISTVSNELDVRAIERRRVQYLVMFNQWR
jgi:hypothetical protein